MIKDNKIAAGKVNGLFRLTDKELIKLPEAHIIYILRPDLDILQMAINQRDI